MKWKRSERFEITVLPQTKYIISIIVAIVFDIPRIGIDAQMLFTPFYLFSTYPTFDVIRISPKNAAFNVHTWRLFKNFI